MDNEEKLNLIVNHLLLNTPNVSNIGLFNGRMGIILFLFIYSDYTQSAYYRKYSELLLEELLEELDVSIPYYFDDGLSGIGWSIEYLLQNQYIVGDSNEILFDLDNEIMKHDLLRIENHSLEKGIIGIIFYALTRLISFSHSSNTFPFDSFYIENLKMIAKLEIEYSQDNYFYLELITEFNRYIANPYIKYTPIEIPYFLYGNNIQLDKPIYSYPLGLINGLAGFGLKLIIK